MIMRYFIICLKKALRSIVCVCVEGGGGAGRGIDLTVPLQLARQTKIQNTKKKSPIIKIN